MVGVEQCACWIPGSGCALVTWLVSSHHEVNHCRQPRRRAAPAAVGFHRPALDRAVTAGPSSMSLVPTSDRSCLPQHLPPDIPGVPTRLAGQGRAEQEVRAQLQHRLPAPGRAPRRSAGHQKSRRGACLTSSTVAQAPCRSSVAQSCVLSVEQGCCEYLFRRNLINWA